MKRRNLWMTMTDHLSPSRSRYVASRLLARAAALAIGGGLPVASAERSPFLQIEAFATFTPGQALAPVLDTIRGARSSILVAAHAFTSRPVALRDASRAGVEVIVIVDAGEATKEYSAAQFLANARLPVRLNARYALQHNKFMVVDGVPVQTGSFNYTASAATRNAENVLVLRNAPAIAAQYTTEWQRLWHEGTDCPRPTEPNLACA